ncbi:uncharacterized protein ACNS7B_011757 [Menidia menidia]
MAPNPSTIYSEIGFHTYIWATIKNVNISLLNNVCKRFFLKRPQAGNEPQSLDESRRGSGVREDGEDVPAAGLYGQLDQREQARGLHPHKGARWAPAERGEHAHGRAGPPQPPRDCHRVVRSRPEVVARGLLPGHHACRRQPEEGVQLEQDGEVKSQAVGENQRGPQEELGARAQEEDGLARRGGVSAEGRRGLREGPPPLCDHGELWKQFSKEKERRPGRFRNNPSAPSTASSSRVLRVLPFLPCGPPAFCRLISFPTSGRINGGVPPPTDCLTCPPCSFRYRGSVLVEPLTERQSHNMDPSEKPEQTDGVQPNHLSPTDLLAATVAGHAKQLELLTTQLNHAFTHLSTEIRTMRASVHSSTDELTRLSGLVAHFPETHPPAPLNPSPVLAPDPSALPSGSTISSNPALLLPDPRLEPNLPCPKSFGGEFGQCRGFLGQCELLFRHQPSRYSAGGARIALIMSLLTDRALAWAIAATSRDLQLTIDYPAFLREFRLVFDHPMDGPDAASRLHSISQGSRSVADYSLEFRTLAADSAWDDNALRSAYRRGLNEAVKDLIIRDRPSTLSELISLALLMDDRLRERRRERAKRCGEEPHSRVSHSIRGEPPRDAFSPSHTSPKTTPLPGGQDEPMELGRSRLSKEEREQRMRDRLCLYCGRPGHQIRSCPIRPKGPAH